MNQRIRDAARKKLATLLKEHGVFDLEDEILSLFGETDEVCDCDKGQVFEEGGAICECPKCKGTGHKLWHIEIVVAGRVIE